MTSVIVDIVKSSYYKNCYDILNIWLDIYSVFYTNSE